MATPPKNALNPEDEIFWYQVREAYAQVAVNSQLEVTLEVVGRKATIASMPFSPNSNDSIIFIFITEVPQPRVTLIVPPDN